MKNEIKLLGVLILAAGLQGCGGKTFSLPSAGQETIQEEQMNTKVDLILMIDNSPSMLRHQQKLNAQIPALIDSLNAQGMDWRIGITNSDVSKGSELLGEPGDQFIFKSQPDYLAKLQKRILVGENSTLERGIETTHRSLENIHRELRQDALLSILFLSDDNDYSAMKPAEFVSFVDSIKPKFRSGLRSWVANYIGTIIRSQECTANLGGWNGIGQKYIDIVNASGGVSENICKASFDQAVKSVKIRMTELLTEFPLARVPKPETLSVLINGQAVPASTTNGWEYIPARNSIKFHGNQVPQPNDVVTINFDPTQAT